jgi:hypothetical protein
MGQCVRVEERWRTVTIFIRETFSVLKWWGKSSTWARESCPRILSRNVLKLFFKHSPVKRWYLVVYGPYFGTVLNSLYMSRSIVILINTTWKKYISTTDSKPNFSFKLPVSVNNMCCIVMLFEVKEQQPFISLPSKPNSEKVYIICMNNSNAICK